MSSMARSTSSDRPRSRNTARPTSGGGPAAIGISDGRPTSSSWFSPSSRSSAAAASPPDAVLSPAPIASSGMVETGAAASVAGCFASASPGSGARCSGMSCFAAVRSVTGDSATCGSASVGSRGAVVVSVKSAPVDGMGTIASGHSALRRRCVRQSDAHPACEVSCIRPRVGRGIGTAKAKVKDQRRIGYRGSTKPSCCPRSATSRLIQPPNA